MLRTADRHATQATGRRVRDEGADKGTAARVSDMRATCRQARGATCRQHQSRGQQRGTSTQEHFALDVRPPVTNPEKL
jgi:hypothetical protein